MSIKSSVRLDELDLKVPRSQNRADSIHDGAIILDPARRVILLAIDAPAHFDRHAHGEFSRRLTRPARSAATTSPARSMSNTRGKATP